MRDVMQWSMCRIVDFCGHGGETLQGALFPVAQAHETIIHVHGSLGNFYQNGWIRELAGLAAQSGREFFSVNMSAHDGLAEGYREDGRFHYIGGSVVPFETCIEDIEGAVDFVRRRGRRPILQGHSLGCDRVLAFVRAKKIECPVILLSPCDSKELHRRWLSSLGMNFEDQMKRMRLLGACEWLEDGEYGIAEGEGWTYSIPIRNEAFLAIAQGAPFEILDHTRREQLAYLETVLCVIGERDPLQVLDREIWGHFLKSLGRSVRVRYIARADHGFSGHANELFGEIDDYLKRADRDVV